MTLKEALRIVKEFGFEKVTVTTKESGNEQLFHYFYIQIGDVQLMLKKDEDLVNTEWYGSISDYKIKFYTKELFHDLCSNVKKGEWQ